MAFYVQYNEDGTISATVSQSGSPPNHPRQLRFEDPVDIQGKKVNLETRSLEDDKPTLIDRIQKLLFNISTYKIGNFYNQSYEGTALVENNFTELLPSLNALFDTVASIYHRREGLNALTDSQLLNIKNAASDILEVLIELETSFKSGVKGTDWTTIAQKRGEKQKIIDSFNTRYDAFITSISYVMMIITSDNLKNVSGAVKNLSTEKGVEPFSINYASLSDSHRNAAIGWLATSAGLTVIVILKGLCVLNHISNESLSWPEQFFSAMSIRIFLLGLSTSCIFWSFKNYRLEKHNQMLNKQKELSIRSFQEFEWATQGDADIRRIVVDRISRTIFDNNNFGFLKEEADHSPDPAQVINLLTQLMTKKSE